MLRRSLGAAIGAVACYFVFVPVWTALLCRVPLLGTPATPARIGGALLSGACTAGLVWAISRRAWDGLLACALAVAAMAATYAAYEARAQVLGDTFPWSWTASAVALLAGAAAAGAALRRRA